MPNCRSKSASVISASGAMLNIAAPFTRMSTGPTSAAIVPAIASIDWRWLTSTRDRDRAGADLGGRRVCFVDEQVGDDDARPFFDIALGDCAADAAGAAGDDGGLVCKPHQFLPERH